MPVSDWDNSSLSTGEIVHQAAAAEDDARLRLDQFLAARIPGLSRSRLKQLIEAGSVTRQGEKIRDANTRVKPGELYHIAVPAPVAAKPQPQKIPLAIVHEDADVIVIDKPAGLVVHPAAGNPDGTLVNALIAHCGSTLGGLGGEARPGIVHRLDKDTSGLLVAAKNNRAMHSLARQFEHHTIERAYHAVVWGAPRVSQGTVEGEIGRNPFDRKRMAVLRGGGKHARTHYRVMGRYGDPERPFASLLECRLETGRTHQIRVHLTHLGHPLIGDSTYGRARQVPRAKSPEQERAFAAVRAFPRQALHAYLLGFKHPTSGKMLRFEAPWPGDLAALLASLRGLQDG